MNPRLPEPRENEFADEVHAQNCAEETRKVEADEEGVDE